MKIYLPTNYYRQSGGDQTKPYPAESYEGWKRAELPIETDSAAIVCMHAWDTKEDGTFPGLERCVDYVPRASKICRELLGDFLDKVRLSGMRLIHVADAGQIDLEEYEGRRIIRDLYSDRPDVDPSEYVLADSAVSEIRSFKSRFGHTGEENFQDVAAARKVRGFNPYVRPKGDEPVVINSHQLASYCRDNSIDHLIYTGFAINMCLLLSPGGMLDMARRGIMCSSVRELVTAVENRESARGERNKEYGLWLDGLLYGVVYNKEDLEKYVLDELIKRKI